MPHLMKMLMGSTNWKQRLGWEVPADPGRLQDSVDRAHLPRAGAAPTGARRPGLCPARPCSQPTAPSPWECPLHPFYVFLV